ncbi:MAG: methyl-accepting chemotaxis protein [Gammaproteobacteria bacterium]|nr:methyl-accepting chemotaxis protein [Gammaproteobacteria bacterium]
MAAKKNTQFTLNGLYRQGDTIMVGVLWFNFLVSLVVANFYDTWTTAFTIGLPAALVPTLLKFIAPGARITRVSVGIAFMVFSALLIHQAHGMLEMHFGIFVLLAFLLYYRDWLPILIAAGVIAVHHLSFNYLQAWGYGVYLFDHRNGLDYVLLHAAYVVFETAILVFMSYHARKEAYQTEEIHEIGAHLRIVDGNIDLTYRHDNASSEFTQGFNAFMTAIHDVIGNARRAAEQMSTSATQLSQITVETSQDVQRQLTETDQTATAINEMSATTQEVARNASSAAQSAREADTSATEGRAVVDETVNAINNLAREVEHAAEAISALESESDNIGKVLDVIKDIAEQTNLLALNAAIEAARAGEQGRGFAVVADEVRTLASRTQQSTTEIEDMISRLQDGAKRAVAVMSSSRTQAQSSVEDASKAGQALQTIAEAISAINDMNTMIASAAEEQTAVSEDVNRSVVSITDFTHRSANNSAQIASASEELSHLANELESMVVRFKL